MSKPTRLVLVPLLILGAGLIPSDRADAFSWFQLGGVDVVWPGSTSLRYLSPTTFPVGSDTDILIQEAMGLWGLVPTCDFAYSFVRADQDYPIDNFDGFSDTIAVPAASLDPGVLGATYMVNDGAAWFDMDMVFSDLPDGVGYTMAANPTCDEVTNPTPTNGYSFLLIAVHEMGHALGLGHEPIGNEPPGTAWLVATMNPRYPSGGPIGQENIVELHTDDRNGARYLYPHSGPSGPPMTDLASSGYTFGPVLGKAVPVFFTPTNVLPGDTLSVRSVIENFGTTSEFFVRQGFYLSTDAVIETTDMLLGSLLWDIAFEDAIDFDVDLDLLDFDVAPGTYTIGTILDDLDEVLEAYEDNNAASYCQPLTVDQLAPAVDNIVQQVASCNQAFTGPTPTVTHPNNMAPITWSLDNPEPSMTVNPATGVVSWPSPVRSQFQYQIFLRATNGAGTMTRSMLIGVSGSAPQIAPIADETITPCSGAYTGPTPTITDPACMEPIINWSLDTATPPGMTLDFGTGIVSWTNPVASATPYTITLRATNASGNGTQSWDLLVLAGDIDGDGLLTVADIPGFVDVLLGLDSAHVSASDLNCDALANGEDVQPFVDLLLSGL